MSIFQRALISASRGVDRIFGETLRLTPKVAGRYQGDTTDPDRDEFDAIGAFREGPDRTKLLTGKTGRDFDEAFVVAKTFATIDLDVLAGRVVKAGDVLTRMDAAGTPAFSVITVEPDGARRLIITLDAITADAI